MNLVARNLQRAQKGSWSTRLSSCRRTLTLHDWENKLDAFLQFNEREVLTHAGKLRTDVAEKLALER